ncbi:MAG: hypothetical protein ACK4SR_04755 [Thiobacillus sp.]
MKRVHRPRFMNEAEKSGVQRFVEWVKRETQVERIATGIYTPEFWAEAVLIHYSDRRSRGHWRLAHGLGHAGVDDQKFTTLTDATAKGGIPFLDRVRGKKDNRAS